MIEIDKLHSEINIPGKSDGPLLFDVYISAKVSIGSILSVGEQEPGKFLYSFKMPFEGGMRYESDTPDLMKIVIYTMEVFIENLSLDDVLSFYNDYNNAINSFILAQEKYSSDLDTLREKIFPKNVPIDPEATTKEISITGISITLDKFSAQMPIIKYTNELVFFTRGFI